ncbi:MAG: hypothetical protein LJE64_09720 [Desulfofustis sp.]|jgi:hypothetical protein|nr:hypothetical protein [Desulfofustis sp.]
MSAKPLRLISDGGVGTDCVCLLIVPQRAIHEPGYIRGLHASGVTNKHEFQALAQTAYYQYQDGELECFPVSEPIEIIGPGGSERLDAGLVLYRDTDGAIRGIVHESVSLKRLLESAHRFCTRWVRLDI